MPFRYLAAHGVLTFFLLLVSGESFAFVSSLWGYFQKYQLGFDYTNSYDGVTANYETARSGGLAEGCKEVSGKDDRQRCHIGMSGGASSGWGIFLQQAFKRQGFFHFDADIGFGVRYLQGGVSEKDKEKSLAAGLPLQNLSFQLAALVMKPYIQLGITPASTWPDILLSIGPAAQVALGRVVVNDKSESVAMSTSSSIIGGFLELELVLWRFGEGALSVFTSREFTGGSNGTRFYPKAIDGMEDIRADFSRSVGGGLFGFGLKILLNWP